MVASSAADCAVPPDQVSRRRRARSSELDIPMILADLAMPSFSGVITRGLRAGAVPSARALPARSPTRSMRSTWGTAKRQARPKRAEFVEQRCPDLDVTARPRRDARVRLARLPARRRTPRRVAKPQLPCSLLASLGPSDPGRTRPEAAFDFYPVFIDEEFMPGNIPLDESDS